MALIFLHLKLPSRVWPVLLYIPFAFIFETYSQFILTIKVFEEKLSPTDF